MLFKVNYVEAGRCCVSLFSVIETDSTNGSGTFLSLLLLFLFFFVFLFVFCTVNVK